MLINESDTDLLIIIPPAGITNSIYPPYGAMHVAGALRKHGYSSSILNADAERLALSEIVERIRRFAPRYIGFSAIVAPSYGYIKELSAVLRREFPHTIQVLGGGLSSAAEVVLKHTCVDIVVRGEGEVTALELLRCLDKKGDLHSVPGLYFRDGNKCHYTGFRKLIGNLDTLSYPAFDLVDMERYITDGVKFINFFTNDITDKRISDKKRSRRMMTIETSRGCFGECSFCFRAFPGLRVHSMKYVFDLIEYCIERFNVRFFSIGDECFAPNKERNWAFIEEYKRRKLDIIFRILGMRVDTIDRDILRAYKEIGCWMIEYGFEAGSQKMLNIIDKRVTVEQNRNAAIWTAEAGIFTSPALVLAMPGETESTIRETINFLKSLNFYYKQYQWKYALPIPGSHLYEYAKLVGAIDDEDKYLMSLKDGKDRGAIFIMNLTDEPDEVVASWDKRLKNELDDYYFKSTYKFELLARLMRVVTIIELYYRRKDLMPMIARRLRSIYGKVFQNGVKKESHVATYKTIFRKRPGFEVESLLKDIDHSVLTKEVALKNINNRLKEMSAEVNAK